MKMTFRKGIIILIAGWFAFHFVVFYLPSYWPLETQQIMRLLY